MIVYLADKKTFRNDVFSNRIEEVILGNFQKRRGRSVGASEIASWKNSLGYMDRILGDPGIPEDAGVGIEYGLPNSEKRIDFVLTGTNADGGATVVIVELKQWSEAEVSPKDGIVRTFLNGGLRETTHPSYQAWSYAAQIEDYNETVQNKNIGLRPCAYLHNCADEGTLRHPHYREHLLRAPVFLKDDAAQLREFLKHHVRQGDKGSTLYEIDAGRIRPSKSLADSLLSLMQGNREFLLLDEQKLVYETALHLAHRASDGPKQTLIVEGGPGTGKSVVAINLLVELTARSHTVKYVTKNAAPRAVYEAKLTGHFKKSRISNLFTNSGSFIEAEPDTFDALVIDEAHRLNAKSGMFRNLGENQIKELIEASRLSVFFVDDAQQVTLQDIGNVASIRAWAKRCGAEVTLLALESQFRCNGSDGYLAWIDNTLEIRETANRTLEGVAYDFAVCDSAAELRGMVRERNRLSNRARMVAGYCWDWVSKKDKSRMDIVLEDGAFTAKWNLDTDGSLWILQPNSVEEVGCIHTCQGLELDYVGVILGPDLVIRDGCWVEFPNRRSKMDSSIKGYKKLSLANLDEALRRAREIIRNTYRTLMTRGLKGCFVHSVDPETNAFLKQAARGAAVVPFVAAPLVVAERIPFRIIPDREARPFENCLPCYADLESAAGYGARSVWGAPPEPFAVRPGYFLARIGEISDVTRIPARAWCLFRSEPVQDGVARVTLVEEPGMGATEIGDAFRAEEAPAGGELSRRGRVRLTEAPAADVRILGEIVAVIG